MCVTSVLQFDLSRPLETKNSTTGRPPGTLGGVIASLQVGFPVVLPFAAEGRSGSNPP